MANKFYDIEPHAPADKIADKPIIQNASLGNEAPNMVPKTPGKIKSLGPSEPHSFPKVKGAAHGFGHAPAVKAGHMRLSGHPSAHRLGGKSRV